MGISIAIGIKIKLPKLRPSGGFIVRKSRVVGVELDWLNIHIVILVSR